MSVALATVVPSSAAPALSLLDEPEPALRAHALRSLDALTDSFWPEISGAVEKIQELSKDKAFAEKELASIVAAKVNFHLGSLDSALHYALAAGSHFNINEQTQFATTLRALCIDEYILLKSSAKPKGAEGFTTELEAVVERVLDGCLANGEINEAIGVALESHRLDKVRQAIIDGCKSDTQRKMALAYCFNCAQTLVASRGYRTEVLSLISEIHLKHFTTESRDHAAVANCMAFVGDAKGTADVLLTLVKEAATASTPQAKEELELTALQIAFDIVDNDAPFFAGHITDLLPDPRPSAVVESEATPDEPAPMDSETAPLVPTPAPEPVTPRSRVSTVELSPTDSLIAKIREILSGTVSASLSLEFLCSQNRSDVPMLKKIKQGLDGRSSVCHSALVFANAIAHSGTAIDTFLRDNLDWLARATAWAKFSATSCLGVIHARHTSSALNLLSPYLPSSAGLRNSSSPSSYSEGGALYALGLISATGGRNVELPPVPGGAAPITAKAYLLEALKAQGAGDVVKHGASLGLGLSAMASWDGSDDNENEYYDDLKALLYTDSAVASEAAALGMGLIACGSGSERVCDEMLAYARETEHEKIVRGLAVGIALVCYGRQDDADSIIGKLKADKDPILRYGGMYAIALAYCGTADNQAIKLLLHAAVTDVSDDVRRAAVISLGFVLFRHPKQLPRIVSLLSESCHAHVRYGAAIAIGIACIGSGSSVGVELLEKLSVDSTDFVRQGALIGLALVYMHHTEERSPKSLEIRKLLEITRSAKLEEVVARFGAVVASGVIDAGGRNGKISFTSENGHPRMSAIVGIAMFTQFWYWYPLVHFIGLSIQPSALIAVNKDLKMPKMKVMSNAPAGLYEYVPSGPLDKQEKLGKAPAAILSVTARNRAREARKAAKKKAESGEDAMTDVKDAAKEQEKKKDEKVEKEEDEKKKEGAKYKILSNPCRVLPGQEYAIEWEVPSSEGEGQRYVPVMKERKTGIVLLRDLKSGEEEDFVEMQSLSTAATPRGVVGTADVRTLNGTSNEEERVADDEAEVPEGFVYTDENKDGDKEDPSAGGGDSTMMDSVE